MRVCPDPNRSIYNRTTGVILPCLCGRWDCPRCGLRKRKKLERRALALKADGHLTLTISNAWTDVDATSPWALEYLGARARVWQRRITRHFGGAIRLWTVEQGEEGDRWHRHYLWKWVNPPWRGRRGWIPEDLLTKMQDWAKDAGLGMFKWRFINDDRGAARYVTKYVTKALKANMEAPAIEDLCVCDATLAECICGAPEPRPAKRFRRFGSNEPYEEPKAPGWSFANCSNSALARSWAYLEWGAPVLTVDFDGALDFFSP